jgi:DNA (cytosine-5)-methyltransferase 1
MAAYYNEVDPFAAAWLRELMKAGQIPDGDVDERSIELVRPADLRGFRQCHFFAGIGGWAYALRLAGWPDDRPVWTGSCPCQPFSSAGTGAGGHDPRDLWPVWFQLVKECRPSVVFGEQVEAAIGHGWLDRLCDDLEAEGYAVGAVGLPGPCVGAFDIRQRLWFVADCHLVLADTDGQRRAGESVLLRPEEGGRLTSDVPEVARRGADDLMADADDTRSQGRRRAELRARPDQRAARASGASFWADADRIACSDGKARPVEPGTFPLAHGIPARVGRLRGYGNAIKPPLAQVFIEAYLDARGTNLR